MVLTASNPVRGTVTGNGQHAGGSPSDADERGGAVPRSAPNSTLTKRCRGCGKSKPLDHFYRESKGRHGRKGKCKLCYDGQRGRTPSSEVAVDQSPVTTFGWVKDDNGCLVWSGPITHSGYGRLSLFGRERKAHRWAYEMAHGPLADDVSLDHLCRNRACVNPDHLEVVSSAENTRRGDLTKLCADDVREMLRLRCEGWTFARIGERFGVSQQHAHRVCTSQNWADVVEGASA